MQISSEPSTEIEKEDVSANSGERERERERDEYRGELLKKKYTLCTSTGNFHHLEHTYACIGLAKR